MSDFLSVHAKGSLTSIRCQVFDKKRAPQRGASMVSTQSTVCVGGCARAEGPGLGPSQVQPLVPAPAPHTRASHSLWTDRGAYTGLGGGGREEATWWAFNSRGRGRGAVDTAPLARAPPPPPPQKKRLNRRAPQNPTEADPRAPEVTWIPNSAKKKENGILGSARRGGSENASFAMYLGEKD